MNGNETEEKRIKTSNYRTLESAFDVIRLFVFYPTQDSIPGSFSSAPPSSIKSRLKSVLGSVLPTSNAMMKIKHQKTFELVYAFITSKLDSANSLLYGLLFLIDCLQNAQNAAARVIIV